MATFEVEDYNGDIFTLGGEGELEVMNDVYVTYVAPNRPLGFPPGSRLSEVLPVDRAAAEAWLEASFHCNLEHLLVEYRNVPVPPSRANIEKIAYMRTLLIREGFVNEATLESGVKYNFCLIDTLPAVVNGGITLNAITKRYLRSRLMDAICLCAYFFRVRGHHYLSDFEAKLANVWRKCQYEENDMGLPWKHVMLDTLKGIQPRRLDEIWINACAESKCAGALQKRLDSRPAGSANVAALRRGIDDLLTVVPRLENRLADAEKALTDHERLLDAHRWNGSVNSRFYGASRCALNEGSYGTMASIIYGALDTFAPNAPLFQSAALKRMGLNAPITGSLINAALAALSKKPEEILGDNVIANP